MRRLFLVILLLISTFGFALSETRDGYFSSSSENGITGILETPSARIMEENTFRMNFSQVKPYRNYGLSVSLYDRLELSGRFTEILGADMSDQDSVYWDGYGNYKDKFIAGKLRIKKETKYLPEIAVGLNDPHGTKLFGAQYFVMSKQIYPFDFSFGMGLGRYGDKSFNTYSKKDVLMNFVNPKEYLDNGNPFFSVNFRPSENFALVYEYNPIKYENQKEDPAVVSDLVDSDSKHSFGARYYIGDNSYLTLSYQRGNQVGIGFTMPFRVGVPVVPIYHPKALFTANEVNAPDPGKIINIMLKNGFSNISIAYEGSELVVAGQNNMYFYEQDAIQALATSMNDIGFQSDVDVRFIITDTGVQIYNFRLNRDISQLYATGQITGDELFANSKVNTRYHSEQKLNLDHPIGATQWAAGYKPQFNFYLNDPSGFFKGSYGVKGWASYRVARSTNLIGGIAFYPFNDISSINQSEDEAIRSDIAEYIDKKLLLDLLLADYKVRIPDSDVFANVEAGILETQFAGINAEIGAPFFNNNFMVGMSATVARKRDKDDYLGIQNDKNYETAFLKNRIHFRNISTYVDIDAGRFLGRDVGAKVKITKNINGVELSAWYTKTDTSVFHADFNKGYSDKGIMVTVPIRLFKGRDSRSKYTQSMSPWTRDQGAQIAEFTNVFDLIDARYRK